MLSVTQFNTDQLVVRKSLPNQFENFYEGFNIISDIVLTQVSFETARNIELLSDDPSPPKADALAQKDDGVGPHFSELWIPYEARAVDRPRNVHRLREGSPRRCLRGLPAAREGEQPPGCRV